MDYFFTIEERNAILETLEAPQKEYLLQKLKRGKQTLFSNELARGKGTYTGSDSELEKEIEEWEFIELRDAGPGSRPYRCECGMALRFQYIVRNSKTKEIKKFGRNHFEFHTGIPSSIVKDIIKGFERLDYELDELLHKLLYGWDHKYVELVKQEKIELPSDIAEQLKLSLPLLNKQLAKLQRLLHHVTVRQTEKKASPAKIPPAAASARKLSFIPDLQSPLGSDIHRFIIQYLEENGKISVWSLCEELDAYPHDYPGRFLTGKPKIFPYGISIMDQLVSKGACTLDKADIEDRWYTICGESVSIEGKKPDKLIKE
ncbi:hypothetical protein [Peribacillus kribbensis]|uniref:hypothetical protein n=1 Tax=Peribacillus kribbensis TaxID=356658 RepID=UPI000418CD14|nr:hypothetical protein [Peribacillus kribbensis]